MTSDLAKSIQRFQDEMRYVDDLAHVLLKGHLLIEEALPRILEQFLFHQQHLSEAGLRFYQKLQLARGLCLRKNRVGEWELMLAINSLRNELAHSLNSPERQKKLARVKDLYFREGAGSLDMEEHKKQPDSVVLLYACSLCAGFLSSFEADAKSFRRMMHSMDRTLNPDAPAFGV